ncbi:hypothetical protein ACFYO9_30445 [Streptomyces sp. NPDC005863]|uniref:hypothetical protein n=1 Tax=unclassified Streptomyces TaxID=2593676 RepID=UPI0033F14212
MCDTTSPRGHTLHRRSPRHFSGEQEPKSSNISLAWEGLHELPLLFPSSLVSAHHERPSSANARRGTTMNDDIQDLISWINSGFR